MEVSSSDTQALQLLSSPSAVTIILTREVACASLGPLVRIATGGNDAGTSLEVVAQGVSWAVTNLPEATVDSIRILEGEINIPPKADSNITLALFYLRVSKIRLYCRIMHSRGSRS